MRHESTFKDSRMSSHFSRKSIYEGGREYEGTQHLEDEIRFSDNNEDMEHDEEESHLLQGIDASADVKNNFFKLQDMIQHSVTKKLNFLNFENYNITDLSSIIQEHKWNILEKINVSKNQIVSIDILNNYPKLLHINANNCYITRVQLKLKHLISLDLSHNFLKEFPNLQTPHLEVINLNSNSMRNLEKLKIEHFNLKSINVAVNPLVFGQYEDLFDNFETLKTKKRLKYLHIDEDCATTE